MTENLITGLKKCGLPEERIPEIAEKMDRYIKEIILFNSAYNLTNTSDYNELVVRHILDSLSAYPLINEYIKAKGNTSFLLGDIGSGGGLPGIPLATVFPDVHFQLVERMAKRCAFLENCSAILGLNNVEVINSEAEKLAPETFDLIVFRAFRPLDEKMTKTLLRIVKKDGLLAAYKAKLENISEEMKPIEKLIGSYEVKQLFVPGLEDSERNLVFISK
ncbi:MAG: 16S rRNA (guanine(527)-N(7))-methyltransferase RsmG [Treponema sp.]|nr:16S rRNA (guanine(527)-N(7))-methyltransferase RsmG [Treponema sp.]